MEKLKIEKQPGSSAAEEKRAALSAMVLQNLKENAATVLEAMHFCFIISYFVTALFKWPVLAPDRETQSKLYAMFFSCVQEMQSELVKFVPHFYGQGDTHNMGRTLAGVIPLREFIQLLSGLSTASRLGEFPLFAGMHNPLVSIMDLIWRNSSDFVEFEDRNGTKIKNWREVERYTSPTQHKRSENAQSRMNKVLDFVKKNPNVFSIANNDELVKLFDAC